MNGSGSAPALVFADFSRSDRNRRRRGFPDEPWNPRGRRRRRCGAVFRPGSLYPDGARHSPQFCPRAGGAAAAALARQSRDRRHCRSRARLRGDPRRRADRHPVCAFGREPAAVSGQHRREDPCASRYDERQGRRRADRGAAPGVPRQTPLPVEIRPAASTPFQIIREIAGPLLQPLATAGIVVVFVIFFLLQREDLRDRFIRLAGAQDLQRTTQGLDDAGRRLSRYLLTQTAINTGVGALVGTGLWLIGVPNPALWGILTMLLRFVPYVGPIIAAAFPAMLAFAVAPGWSMMFWVIGLFLAVELVTGYVIEPWLYGHSTGLSGVAVLVAAAFWTLLWGPVGLLLSTPLTMCLVVLGRHVEHLRFLEVLLGDRPALAPEESFYQRILADDPDEAASQAEAFLKDKPLSVYYDEVAIRGLALAQLDVNRGVLDHARRVRIKQAVDWVIDDLCEHED